MRARRLRRRCEQYLWELARRPWAGTQPQAVAHAGRLTSAAPHPPCVVGRATLLYLRYFLFWNWTTFDSTGLTLAGPMLHTPYEPA